jgi:hypothetical protein
VKLVDVGWYRNQPHVAKSLLRVLGNLEDQSGCIAQLFIASVDPKGGNLKVQKYVFFTIMHTSY